MQIRVVLALATAVALASGACGGAGAGSPEPAPTSRPAITSPSPAATPATQATSTPFADVVAPATPVPAPTALAIAPATAQPRVVPAPTSPSENLPPAAVTFQITAQNVAFDKAEVRARAGAQVTAVFTNKDAGVDHNLTFSAPGLPHGDTCTGPCTATQSFSAPAPGRYNFFCNIHSVMIGDFIVDP